MAVVGLSATVLSQPAGPITKVAQVLPGSTSVSLGPQTTTTVSAVGSEQAATWETLSQNLRGYPKTLQFSAGLLVGVTFDLGGGLTIQKTLGYVGNQLASVTLSGAVPDGLLARSKVLTYASGVLVGTHYE